MTKLRAPRGFTLIEVLIAMAITAMVATLAFASLDSTMDSAEALREQGERISEINRAWNLMSRDLSHFINRPVRNEFGNQVPAMVGGERVDQQIAFTRVGWFNTLGRQRSHMQRVRYVLEDTTLYREQYQVLDRTNESEPQRVALLEDVNLMEFRFLADSIALAPNEVDTENWAQAWGLNGGQGVSTVPEAIEVRLELDDWGEVRWLYELPQAEI